MCSTAESEWIHLEDFASIFAKGGNFYNKEVITLVFETFQNTELLLKTSNCCQR